MAEHHLPIPAGTLEDYVGVSDECTARLGDQKVQYSGKTAHAEALSDIWEDWWIGDPGLG